MTTPEPTTQPADGPPQVGILELEGNEFRLWDLPFTIGRSSKSALTLRDPHLSRTHCVIDATAQGYAIQNASSRNAVRVNGAPIDQPALLADGDTIEISKHRLVFRLVDEDGNPVSKASAAELPVAVSEAVRASAGKLPAAPEPAPAPPATSTPAPAPMPGTQPSVTQRPRPASERRGQLSDRHRSERAPRRRGMNQADMIALGVAGALGLLALAIGSYLLIAQTQANQAELRAYNKLLTEVEGRSDGLIERYRQRQLDEQDRLARYDDLRMKLRGEAHALRRKMVDRYRELAARQPQPAPPVSSAAASSVSRIPVASSSASVSSAPASSAAPKPTALAHAAGPPATGAGLPFFGLTIDRKKVVLVIDGSERISAIKAQVSGGLKTFASALGEGHEFTMLVGGDEPARVFSNGLLEASDRFVRLAGMFAEKLEPRGRGPLAGVLAKARAIRGVEAVGVVVGRGLVAADLAALRAAIQSSIAGSGPAIYLVDAAGLTGAEAPSAVDALLTLARSQR